MRTRKEIEFDENNNKYCTVKNMSGKLLLEVLLDIRELLRNDKKRRL